MGGGAKSKVQSPRSKVQHRKFTFLAPCARRAEVRRRRVTPHASRFTLHAHQRHRQDNLLQLRVRGRRGGVEDGALLVLDEIYTGFGRTGRWFACEHAGTIPDLICLGKALAGGFPLSACVGKAELMDAAWPRSEGEAIHTSTFLGHPVGCAMALAQVAEIRKRELVQSSADLGEFLLRSLSSLRPPSSILPSARGLGLMAG